MRSFKFEKSLMQEHFNEKYMESDKYPQATYKGKVNDKIDTSRPGKYKVTTTGTIYIHGKEKAIDESGEVEVTDTAHMIISSHFFVALEDFNIKKPQILFNNIADTIEVKIKAYYKPYQKKPAR
jgi:polyisoprenoid-binding protein YceI